MIFFPSFSPCYNHCSFFLSFVFQLRLSSELGQDILNDCLTVQPLQPAPSPHDAADNTMEHSPGPAHDIYPGIEKDR